MKSRNREREGRRDTEARRDRMEEREIRRERDDSQQSGRSSSVSGERTQARQGEEAGNLAGIPEPSLRKQRRER